MALVVLPEGQQRSGKQGGMVWSHNAGGPYVRNRTIPTNPNTDRQVAIRNAVRSLAIGWGMTLTQAQRDAWEQYGSEVAWVNRLGQTITLKGMNHYVRTNTISVSLGFGRIDEAPVINDVGSAELALGCTASQATQQLTITFDDAETWANEPGAFQHFYMGRPQNASIRFFKGPYRYVVSIAGVTPAVSPLLASAPWVFGEGQRIWLQSRIMRADGRLSEFAQVNFLSVA